MLTPRTPPRSYDGPRGSLSMRLWALGMAAGQRPLQARLARLCRSHRSSSDRRTTGVPLHHTMTCTDLGGRATDGAGSSVAAERPDRARTVALQPLPGWCGCVYKPGWLWPLRMAKRVSKSATRGGERQSTEAPGYRIRAPRPERSVRSVSVSVDKAAGFLFFWRLRARRFVGSVTWRRGGPPAHRPSGRGPGCGFASHRAIAPPSQSLVS